MLWMPYTYHFISPIATTVHSRSSLSKVIQYLVRSYLAEHVEVL